MYWISPPLILLKLSTTNYIVQRTMLPICSIRLVFNLGISLITFLSFILFFNCVSPYFNTFYSASLSSVLGVLSDSFIDNFPSFYSSLPKKKTKNSFFYLFLCYPFFSSVTPFLFSVLEAIFIYMHGTLSFFEFCFFAFSLFLWSFISCCWEYGSLSSVLFNIFHYYFVRSFDCCIYFDILFSYLFLSP